MAVFLNEVFMVCEVFFRMTRKKYWVHTVFVTAEIGKSLWHYFHFIELKTLASFHKPIFIEFRFKPMLIYFKFKFTFTPNNIFLAEAFGEPPVLRPVPPFWASFPSSFPV